MKVLASELKIFHGLGWKRGWRPIVRVWHYQYFANGERRATKIYEGLPKNLAEFDHAVTRAERMLNEIGL